MKKVFMMLALAAVLFAGYANAEVKEVTITGSIDLDLIWRGNYEAYDNDVKDQPAYAELEVNVFINAELTDNVSAEISLMEGMNSDAADADNISFDLATSYITAKEFLWEELTMKIGRMPLYYSTRGNEGCEDHMCTGGRSLRRASDFIVSAEFPLTLYFNVDLDQWQVDFWWMKIEDNSKLGDNNRIMHVGDETGNSTDEDAYGLVVSYYWKETNMARGMMVYWNDNSANSSVLNSLGATQTAEFDALILSFGLNMYFLDDNLEFYGEIAYQWGEFDDPADMDIGAFGGYLGLEYAWSDHAYIPYLGLEVMFKEGDDDDDAAWQNMSGSFNTAIIFEGVEQDHNPWEDGGYGRATLYGGLKKFGPEDDMNLDIHLSYLWNDNDSADSDDNIGWEADILWGWNYTEDLRFELAFGYFFVDDDYATWKNGAGSDDDDAWLLVWNTTLTF